MSVRQGLVGAAVVIVGLFAVGRLVAWWLERSENITGRQRSVHDNLVTLVVLFLSVGVPILFRIFPVGYSLLPSGPTLAAALLNSVIAAAVAGIGLGAALRGSRPIRTARQMVRGELWRRNRTVVGAWIALILILALTVEFGALYLDSASILILGSVLLAFTGLLLSGFVALPAYCPYIRFGVRRPTDAERARIEQVYDRLDIPLPDGIEITVQDDHERLTILENDGQRVLALSDSVLSSFDEETLTVGIAHAEGRATHSMSVAEKASTSNFVFLLDLLLLSLLLAILEVRKAALVGVLVLIAGLLLTAVLIGGWSRKRVRLVDEYTVEHADPSTVANVYGRDKRIGFVQTRKASKHPLLDRTLGKLATEPSMQDRLEHVGLAGHARSDALESEGAG